MSPWLSERMIARLSPARRDELFANIKRHVARCVKGRNARDTPVGLDRTRHHLKRKMAVLGRCAMLISNVELRERASHG